MNPIWESWHLKTGVICQRTFTELAGLSWKPVLRDRRWENVSAPSRCRVGPEILLRGAWSHGSHPPNPTFLIWTLR